jgi:branched-chain amino acid transport system permease protein
MLDVHDLDEMLSVAREFRANPFGQHSPNLQKLLREFRSEPVPGKHALLAIAPHRSWMLIELTGNRQKPFIRHEDTIFTSLAEAEWCVFCLRWERSTGQRLSLPEPDAGC